MMFREINGQEGGKQAGCHKSREGARYNVRTDDSCVNWFGKMENTAVGSVGFGPVFGFL